MDLTLPLSFKKRQEPRGTGFDSQYPHDSTIPPHDRERDKKERKGRQGWRREGGRERTETVNMFMNSSVAISQCTATSNTTPRRHAISNSQLHLNEAETDKQHTELVTSGDGLGSHALEMLQFQALHVPPQAQT